MNQGYPQNGGGYPQQMVQVTTPPAVPQCCCGSARGCLIFWLIIVMIFSVATIFSYLVNPYAAAYMIFISTPTTTYLTYAIAGVQVLGALYPLIALAKKSPKAIKRSAFWYILFELVSWGLTVASYVLTTTSYNTLLGSSPSEAATLIRDALNTAQLITMGAIIGIHLLFLAIIVNRMFAVRRYLLAMDQYSGATGQKAMMQQVNR